MKRVFCDSKMNGIYFVRLLFKTNLKEYQSKCCCGGGAGASLTVRS